MKLFLAIKLFFILIKEILVASLQVAVLAVRNGPDVQPALLMIPLRISAPMGVYLFSSMITLTPGTLSVDVQDGNLLVHVLDTDNPEEAIRVLQTTFEDPLLEIFGESK